MFKRKDLESNDGKKKEKQKEKEVFPFVFSAV